MADCGSFQACAIAGYVETAAAGADAGARQRGAGCDTPSAEAAPAPGAAVGLTARRGGSGCVNMCIMNVFVKWREGWLM